jgi:uncharacterized protein (DUF305 family)
MTVTTEAGEGLPVDDGDEDTLGGDVESLLAGRNVSLGHVIIATLALMFLTGAIVYAWQQWANEPHPNDVDIGFADDMVTHHLQGVAMSLAYLEDGTDPILRQTANEIVLVQAGEARLLGQALEDWGRPDVDSDTAMDWMDMAPVPQNEQPGMATDEEMEELAAAEGDQLDELFSRLMVEHHRGGLHMSSYAEEHGAEPDITHLAGAMATTQRSEIAELNLQREALGFDAV